MTKTKKKLGTPTKYNTKIAEELAEHLTSMSIKDACKEVGIGEKTYYNWLHRYEDFLQLSTKSRKTKAIHHFHKCEEVLEMIDDKYYDEKIRSDLVRLKLDFHLRLAGKANQGLFGDKVQVDDVSKKEPVALNITLNEE